MATNDEVKEIFEAAMKDPSLLSTINIESLIDNIENDANNYLEEKTMEMINNDIFNIIKNISISIEDKKNYCDKLIGYRIIEDLHELHKGKHVRWIRKNNGKLTNGGIIVDIKFYNDGTQILCMGSGKRFIQYKYDDCITFQKMSEAEQLIVMAYEYTNK
tara:strand:+ start:12903 stop:13382 length:480 start_codon:yes stop_codon:yes gene_type:complete